MKREREIRKQVKKTERMLIATLASIGVAIVFLVGSTYAWFSASIESGVNVIKTGAFDVSIEWSRTYDGTYQSLSGTDIFSGDSIAPGQSLIRYIKITNSSDYAIDVSAALDFNVGDGNDDLSSVVSVYYKQDVDPALALTDMTPVDTIESLQTASGTTNNKYTLFANQSMAAGTPDPTTMIVAVAFKLDESSNPAFAGAAQSRFKLNLMAVQKPGE